MVGAMLRDVNARAGAAWSRHGNFRAHALHARPPLGEGCQPPPQAPVSDARFPIPAAQWAKPFSSFAAGDKHESPLPAQTLAPKSGGTAPGSQVIIAPNEFVPLSKPD